METITTTGREKLIWALSLSGVLFAGYLTGVKLLTGTCAFNEGCPLFLGYPTCWYGLAMYVAMTIAASLALLGKVSPLPAFRIVRAFAGVGVLFSGFYTFQELPKIWREGVSAYLLGLPTCAYGFLVFVTILILSYLAVRAREGVAHE